MGAVSRHRVIFGQTIGEIFNKHLDNLHHESALVLVIQNEESGDALELLMQHRQGAPVLVISPWPQPALPEAARPVRSTKNVSMRRLQCESWVWQLLPDWRERLIRWIGRRFVGTSSHFDSNAALQLLDKFDPGRQWFTRVEDVLVLAQAVAELREQDQDWSASSSGDVSALLDLLFNRDRSNLLLLERLVQERWTSWHLPWSGALGIDEWAVLATGVCQFDIVLDQFVTPCADGHDFRRPIAIRLLLRSYLMRQLNNANTSAWIHACFDDQRRPLLDAALDALSIPQLESVSRSLEERLQLPDYLGVGEALFAAVGRRMLRGESLDNTLPNLLGSVVQRLRQEKDMLIPYSRPLYTPEAQVQWVSICWAWSLRSEPHESARASWQFPAWHEKLPSRVPRWLNDFGASHSVYSWQRLPLPLLEFSGVMRQWLSIQESEPKYEGMAPIFSFGMLAQSATEQRWSTTCDWWHAVIGNAGAEQALLRSVAEDASADAHRVAFAWWPSLVAYRHRQALQAKTFVPRLGTELFTRDPSDHHYSLLLAWVLEQLETHAARALDMLPEEDRLFLMRNPGLLSPSFRRALLKLVPAASNLNLSSFEIPAFLYPYGSDACPEMKALLDHEELGMRAAICLWEWEPRETARLLGKRDLTPIAIRNLLEYSPSCALGVALAVLREHSDLLTQAERLTWAKHRLHDAREYAPQLLNYVLAPQ